MVLAVAVVLNSLNSVPFHNRPEAPLVFLAFIPFLYFMDRVQFYNKIGFFEYRFYFSRNVNFFVFRIVPFCRIC